MGIENIRDHVLESARAEADGMVCEAQEAARKLVEAATARCEAHLSKATEEIRERLQQRHDRDVSSAKASGRLKLLTRKAQILDEIFESAAERFIGNRGGEYQKWLSAQLDSVEGQTGSVVPASGDRKLIEQLLMSRGRGLKLADDSMGALRGGFVLRGENVDLDLSLDTHLAELKQELLPEIAAKVFRSIKNGDV